MGGADHAAFADGRSRGGIAVRRTIGLGADNAAAHQEAAQNEGDMNALSHGENSFMLA
jgi:hypothetical protein